MKICRVVLWKYNCLNHKVLCQSHAYIQVNNFISTSQSPNFNKHLTENSSDILTATVCKELNFYPTNKNNASDKE